MVIVVVKVRVRELGSCNANEGTKGRLLTALSILPGRLLGAFIFKCHFPMAIYYGLELTK